MVIIMSPFFPSQLSFNNCDRSFGLIDNNKTYEIIATLKSFQNENPTNLYPFSRKITLKTYKALMEMKECVVEYKNFYEYLKFSKKGQNKN